MLKSLVAKGIGLQPSYDVNFGPRLNVFTGDNGLGKTFVLEMAYWAITGEVRRTPELYGKSTYAEIKSQTDFKGKDFETVSTFDFANRTWHTTLPRAFGADICIFVGSDGSYSVWDFFRKQYIEKQESFSILLPIQRTIPSATYGFHYGAILNGLVDKSSGKVQCRGLISDLSEWAVNPKHSRKKQLFEKVLRDLSPPGETISLGSSVRVSVDDVREIPTLSFSYGEVPVHLCSAAMVRILSLAYLLIWAWGEHEELAKLLHQPSGSSICFIIDELELHLHPKWQRTILRPLLNIAKTLNSTSSTQLITTTHSPLILASAEPVVNNDCDRLFVFEHEEDEVRLRDLGWTKEGDANAWLTSEPFGLKDTRSVESENAIKEAESFLTGSSTMSESDVEAMLTKDLAINDPFWANWRLRPSNAQ